MKSRRMGFGQSERKMKKWPSPLYRCLFGDSRTKIIRYDEGGGGMVKSFVIYGSFSVDI